MTPAPCRGCGGHGGDCPCPEGDWPTVDPDDDPTALEETGDDRIRLVVPYDCPPGPLYRNRY